MATYLDDIDEGDAEFPGPVGDLDDILPMSAQGPAELGGSEVPAGEESVPVFTVGDDESASDDKPLLEVQGFYVASGPGIFDGAQRDNEEPRESHFVDVQDYSTGQIKRVWGVALGEVMSGATAQFDLKPGSRVHLIQQGKRPMTVDYVDGDNVMQIRQTFANGWVCLPDRGPLPSHLAHLMAGVNVDATLDRLALRYDMGMDDERLPAWKQEMKRIVATYGDDPEMVRSWLNRQLSLTSDEERSLVEKAVTLAGFGEDDLARRASEINMRLSALPNMSAEARYDYLMAAAKPHLVEANRERESHLAREIVRSIEQIAEMATPEQGPDSAERKAMRSALAQCVDGLTVQQQMDYLNQRRDQVVRSLAAQMTSGVEFEEGPKLPRVFRDRPIDATGLTSEEYQQLLQERLDLATTQAEKDAILKQEIEHQKAFREAAQLEFEQLDALYQRFARERDVDAMAYMVGVMVRSLGDIVGSKVLPQVKTVFESLGGLGAWRRNGCEVGLQDLRDSLSLAKQTSTYQGFVNDPQVRAASAGSTPDEMVAKHPNFARTDVVQEHLQAQFDAPAPSGKKKKVEHGLWANVMSSAHTLADRISHMSPEHLIKRGALDSEWVKGMQAGLTEFGADLKKTLMAEELKAQLQEMLASIVSMIKMMMEAARELIQGKATAPALSAVER